MSVQGGAMSWNKSLQNCSTRLSSVVDKAVRAHHTLFEQDSHRSTDGLLSQHPKRTEMAQFHFSTALLTVDALYTLMIFNRGLLISLLSSFEVKDSLSISNESLIKFYNQDLFLMELVI